MQTLRKFLRGHWQVPLLAAFVLLLAVFTARFDPAEPQLLDFQVDTDAGIHIVTPWKNEENIYYVFLPSYCSLSDVRVQLHTSGTVTLDGVPLQSGQTLEGIEPGREYRLHTLLAERTLCFLQSENVTTMYIDTESGSIKAIHSDKENSENAALRLISPDGTLAYSGSSCKIKTRGNASWHFEKKPYNLIFSQPTDLLGMGQAVKWVLLANAADESNLRNKLVFDLGRQLMPDWTPQCEYVDVYLNGEYRGLYLLTERVEVGQSRLDIGSSADSFLCKLEPSSRLSVQDNPIVTDGDRLVEIVYPENISTVKTREIARQVQQLEDTIVQQGELSPLLDLDSWVRRFLIDEVVENLDGDTASSYFYYADGTFFAGPLWDYDHIMGTRDRNLNPEALLGASLYKSAEMTIPYTYALYHNPRFYSRMTEIYETEFLPVLEALAESGLSRMAQTIHAATRLNTIRWEHMFSQWDRPVNTAQDLTEYLQKRIAFLNSAWIEGADYCAIQVEVGDDVSNLNYLNFTVPRGEVFSRISSITVPGEAEPRWVNADTGAAFDPAQPITGDIRLNLVSDPDITDSRQDSLMMAVYLSLLVIGVLLGVWLDSRNRTRKRRRNA